MDKKELGRWGEAFAADKLTTKGFVIVTTNFYTRYGEIDIVAKNEEYLLFVEVKTRSGVPLAAPVSAVHRQKQHKIISSAFCFLEKHPFDLQPRFDVFEIYYNQNTGEAKEYFHYENAFDLEGYHASF